MKENVENYSVKNFSKYYPSSWKILNWIKLTKGCRPSKFLSRFCDKVESQCRPGSLKKIGASKMTALKNFMNQNKTSGKSLKKWLHWVPLSSTKIRQFDTHLSVPRKCSTQGPLFQLQKSVSSTQNRQFDTHLSLPQNALVQNKDHLFQLQKKVSCRIEIRDIMFSLICNTFWEYGINNIVKFPNFLIFSWWNWCRNFLEPPW